MGKLRYREIYSFLLLSVLTGVFVCLFVVRLGVFGSRVDWISQHSVLPDYFRRQFYETGELFPELALQIGGGQNIYNFAYYGLYSPLVLPSYLLPFVKMSDYMIGVQVLCLTASVLLFYGWLRQREFTRTVSFCMAVMFLLSGPMIYHSYNQIMFVNYMPFLCMGLLGVDRYWEDKRRFGLLTVSSFLMIMTSFYFSIGGMSALVLYGIHRYIENYTVKGLKITFKSFFREGIRFVLPFLTAVMLSGILLVPAALSLTGRGSGGGAVLMDLFLPKVPLDALFYSPYGIGLTTLSFTALIATLFSVKPHEKVLAWMLMILLAVPLFVWLLNGGLYIRTKVLIPFLPLLLYVTACYIRRLEEAGPFPYLAALLCVYIGKSSGDVGKYWELVFLDGAVMLGCFMLLSFVQKKLHRRRHKRKNALVLLLPAIIFLAIYGAGLHTEADYAVDRTFYRGITAPDAEELIAETVGKEGGFYRTEQTGTEEENAADLNRIWNMGQYVSSVYSSSYNEEYQKFRQKTFELEQPFRNFLMQSAARNPVYLDFMGVKYLVSKEELAGYKLVGSKGEWKAYENQEALPIIYATDQVISEDAYQELAFPYRQLALREYAVTGEAGKTLREKDIKSEIKELNIKFPKEIQAEENIEYALDISGAEEEMTVKKQGQRVLFLEFEVKNHNPSKDIAVWVAGTRNKLTSRQHFYYNDNTKFTYAVFPGEGQTEIPVTFGKGRYEISDVRCFVGKLSEEAPDDKLCQSEFRVDKARTKGNVIAGKIEVKNAGYLITSVPYDKNFEIWIDGEKAEGEKVNTAFLGCRIEEGKHEVEIVYHAPGIWLGRMVSAAGIMLLGICVWMRRMKT